MWSEKSIETITGHIEDFIDFAVKNKSKYFNVDEDYEIASPEYIKRAYQN
ncbi:MAG: hypothetical protein GY820_00410 [Gammaproteobacteria bacterium]|nr:hypothetical protein [Gammaproteobacteria bacterium]